MTHSDNWQIETNSINKVVDQSSKEKENPNNEHIRNTHNDINHNTRKKITVIADSMEKLLQSKKCLQSIMQLML